MEISADYTDYADYVLRLRSRQEDGRNAVVPQPKCLLFAAPAQPREDSAPWFQRTAVLANDVSVLQVAINLSRNLRILNSGLS